MPALPNVPSVLKFQVRWRIEADLLAITNHYFRYTSGPPAGSDCAAMATAAVTNGDTRFNGICSNYVGMESCEVTDLTSPTAAQGSGGSAWNGSRGSSLLSPSTAILVNHAISRRYRGGKPRSYMPFGVSGDVTSGGIWSSAFVSSASTAWGEWVADTIASGSGCTITNIVNVSYYHGFTVVTSPTTGRSRNVPTLRPTPQVDVITGHTLSQVIASQRRRNRDA